MEVYGDGRGGNSEGSFTVTQLVFDYSSGGPVLTSLSISFEQSAGGDPRTLYGVVNYNYSPAGPAVLDTVVENASQGTDTVLASVSYTLGANLENLTLNRADHINGTGNSLDNVITGNPGNNILDGKAGADTMDGGGGGDTYVVDNVGDIVIEEFDLYSPIYGNFDTVQSSITYILPAEVEALKLTGVTNINGTGNELDNTLTGNIGNNVLNGGLGDDMLVGAGGNDTFNILAGAGSDSIDDFTAGVGVGDVIVLDGFALGSFSAVQSAMTQNGSNTVLNLGNGETLTFLDVAKASFAANDFTFLNVQGPPPPPPGPPPFTLPESGAFTTTSRGRAQTTGSTASKATTR
jgi:Ca2+-binding RTX toxin-like protein